MTGRTLAAAGLCLLAVGAVVSGYIAWLPEVSELRRQNPLTTRYVGLYVGRMRRHGRRPSVAMRWVPLEDISPALRRAVLIKEDDRFFRHGGVDWVEIRKSLNEAARAWKKPRGASTITQQLARNLFLGPHRLPRRKLKEILIARHLERSLSKERILEIYLNTAEWGEGVFGAEAASQAYFGKRAAELSAEESAALAAALSSPYRWNPAQAPDERTRRVRELLLQRLAKEGLGTVPALAP